MVAIFPGAGLAIRTRSLCPSSCSSRRRSPPSSLIITSGCAGFRISLRWRALRKTRCFARGRASVITLVPGIFIPQQKRLLIDLAEISRGKSSECDNFPESGNTPRMPWPALPLINRFRSSKRTLLAFRRDFSICANQLIPALAGKRFGNLERVFSRNPMPRLLTPRFWILARLFVWPAGRNAIYVLLKCFAAQKIRLRFPSENQDPKQYVSSRLMH